MVSSMISNYEKHSRFWLPDGNIILAVKLATAPPSLDPDLDPFRRLQPERANSDKITLYRFYKGLLSMYSPVFRDTFSFAESEETFEDTPVVFLQDSREEIEAMLNIFLPNGQSNPSFLHGPDFLIYELPLMNAAHKYQIDFISKETRQRIVFWWPKSLGEWYKFATADLEPVAAIIFAERYDIPSILPASMYALSCTLHSMDWEKRKLGQYEGTPRAARWTLLSASHLLELGKLREELDAKMRGFYRSVFSTDHRPGVRCSARNADPDKLNKLEREVERHCMSSDTRDVLDLLLNVPSEQSIREAELCDHCVSRINTRRSRKKEELWDFLVQRYNSSR